MKAEQTEMRKEALTPSSLLDTGDLAKASKWIYKHYGNDLTSFFSDAYEAEARRRKHELQETRETEASHL